MAIFSALVLTLATITPPAAQAQETAAPWWVQGIGVLLRGVSAFSRDTDPQRFDANAAVFVALIFVGVLALFGLAMVNERKRHDQRMTKKDEMLAAKDAMLKEEHTATMAFIESSMKRVDAVTAGLVDHTTKADEREKRARNDLRTVAKQAVNEIDRRHKVVFQDFTTKELVPLNDALRTAIAGLNEAATIIRQRDQTLVDTVKTIVQAAVQAAVTPLLPAEKKEITDVHESTQNPDAGHPAGGPADAGAAGTGAGTAHDPAGDPDGAGG